MKENQNTTNSRQERIGENRNIDTLKRIIASLIGMVFFTLLASCGQGGGSSGQNQDGISATGQGFSADMIVTLPSGQVLMESKIFVTPGATRVDWEQGGSNLTSIRLEKENREYLYNHDKKVYYEMDLNEDEEISNFLKSINDYEVIEVLGKESVNGLNCIKKKVRSSFEVMGMNITNELIIWQADGIDFPIRAEGEEGTVTELKNISKKTPSPKLFQPIQGYKQVNNMMEVMGFGGMSFGMDGLGFRDNEGNSEVAAEELRVMIEKYQQTSNPGDKEMVSHLETMLSVREGTDDGRRSDKEDLYQGRNNDVEIDLNKMYENVTSQLQSAIRDPNEVEKMKEILAQARDEAKDMNFSEGAAKEMWSTIPQRRGDTVEDEFKVKNVYGAQIRTNLTMADVCNYYEKALKPKGWKVHYNAVFNGEGLIRLQNNEYSLTINSGDIENNKKLKFYTLQFSTDVDTSKK